VIETTQNGKTLKLTWDNHNRLIQSKSNGQVTQYGYDVFGRRLYKKSSSQDFTLFGWDGDLMIWESSQNTDNPQKSYTKHYIYEPDSFVPLMQAGYHGFIQLIETPDYSEYLNKPYSVYKDPIWSSDTRKNRVALEQTAFYHCDQVGTPQTLTNAVGECVWEITQDTWGAALEIQMLNKDNPFEQSNLRFQGQYYDNETGLHYNRYRYYEPYSARYMSKDPIGLFGGLNVYKYVSNSNQLTDPNGLYVVLDFYKDKNIIVARDLEKDTKLIIRNVYTGGVIGDDGFKSNGTALPTGKYFLVPDDRHPDWYALYGDDGWIDDFTLDGKRSGFRLHPGRVSLGCVTVKSTMNNEQWNKLDEMISTTKTKNKFVWKGGCADSLFNFGWNRK
jgi:RHS repeat-associated protein